MPVPAVRGPQSDPFWAAGRPGVMTQQGYLQSAGNTGPGGILDFLKDWATGTGGPHGIIGGEGTDASLQSVLQDLESKGVDTSSVHSAMGQAKDITGAYVDNPFSGLMKQYMDLGNQNASQAKGVYDQLLQQLQGGQQQYQQTAAQQRGGIAGAYDQANSDVSGISQRLKDQLAQEAQAMGIQGALAGKASQQSTENLARIQAMNAAAKGGSLGNFDTLSSVYNNLLGSRQASAQELSASAQNSALEQARLRYGLSDPSDLYAELMSNRNQGLLQQQQLALQAQQMAAQSAAGGGGGGGGGGRRGGGGSSGGSGGSPGSGDPTVTAQELADLYNRGPTSRVDPNSPAAAQWRADNGYPSLDSQVNPTAPPPAAVTRRITRGKNEAV